MITRRTFTAILLSATALAACSTTPTLGTLATDAQLVVTTLQNAVKGVETAVPTLITTTDQATIATALSTASNLAAGISAATPASGATTVQTIDNYINTTLDVLAGVPLIPVPFSTAIALAATLAPGIEAGVNSLLGLGAASAPLVTPARAKLVIAGMTPAQARAQLLALK
jgi:hypothetical protein